MSKITVVDNYITEEQLNKIRKTVLSENFQWSFSGAVADQSDNKHGYFVHKLMDECQVTSHCFSDGMLDPVLDKLSNEKEQAASVKASMELESPIGQKPRILLRIKANLYPRTEILHEHKPHRDYDFHHRAAVFCLNTCDGATTIGDKRIDSVENRMIFFDGSDYHHSSTCTDSPARLNINFNWIEPENRKSDGDT